MEWSMLFIPSIYYNIDTCFFYGLKGESESVNAKINIGKTLFSYMIWDGKKDMGKNVPFNDWPCRFPHPMVGWLLGEVFILV